MLAISPTPTPYSSVNVIMSTMWDLLQIQRTSRLLFVSGKLPTYPSPKPTFCST